MRKITFLLAFLMLTFMVKAQDQQYQQDDMQNDSTATAQSERDNYNHWSLELQGGVSHPTYPFAEGFYAKAPNLWGVALGARYMITDRAGVKLNFGYDRFDSATNSNTFKSHMYRADLQGVLNVGNIAHFREWSNTFNVLVHGGLGYATLATDEPIERDEFSDNMLYLVAGVTPEIRLGNRVALTLDGSFMNTIRQDLTWDGSQSTDRHYDSHGFMFTGSIGIAIYLGKQNVHADWYNPEENTELEDKIDKLANDLDDLRDELNKEKDKDNFDRYKDRIDNMISNHLKEGDVLTRNNAVQNLINDGYVSVYFPFDKDQPQSYSISAIKYIAKYLQEHPDKSVEIVGYADVIGNSDYNERLSQRRAKKVENILKALGIDESRMESKGMGEDDSVDKNSSEARQMVRRVVFHLK